MTASCGSSPPPLGEIRAVPVPTWGEWGRGVVGRVIAQEMGPEQVVGMEGLTLTPHCTQPSTAGWGCLQIWTPSGPFPMGAVLVSPPLPVPCCFRS